MSALGVVEIKAFVPARDFALSQNFYRELGFQMLSEGGGVAYFKLGPSAFLLQDYWVTAFAENLQMHLQVDDVQAWHDQVKSLNLPARYGGAGAPTPLVDQPWGMRDFAVVDPCGVCWRIAQNIPGFAPVGRINDAS